MVAGRPSPAKGSGQRLECRSCLSLQSLQGHQQFSELRIVQKRREQNQSLNCAESQPCRGWGGGGGGREQRTAL